MRLTEEQRKLVEDSLPLATFFLKRLRTAIRAAGIAPDDAQQIAREALCKCVTTWDPERGALSTWAGLHIRCSIMKACATNDLITAAATTMQNHPEYRKRYFSLNAPALNARGMNLEECLPGASEVDEGLLATDLMREFDERERVVAHGRLDGSTQQQIAASIGLSQAQVSRILSRMQRKAQKYLSCEDAI